MEIRLDGRSALITGGSKGLGLAMATTFAQSGADVAIIARDQQALEAARAAIAASAEVKVRAYSCDVRQPDQIRRTFQSVIDDLGKVDILVNNAGTSRAGRFEDASDEVWQEDLDLKLFAAIRLTRLAFPAMKERRWGRIINVLNIGAKAPRPNSAPTAVSRAAGLALTKILSGEGALHNVLVNALLVGLIKADQHIQHFKQNNAGAKSMDEYYANLGSRVPLGRVGEAQEFANIACFLASDAASYITGTAINVDGGTSPVV